MSSLSSVISLSTPSTVSGLATGLDTDKIIQGLLSIQQQQIQRLTAKQKTVATQQNSFKDIEAKLLAFQSKLGQLGRSQNGVFDARQISSSDETLLTAAASSSATPGVYSLRVTQLASAHQLASQGYDDPNSQISQGTLQIGIGAATTTLTIDSTNNTLSGLESAINNAGIGINAALIKDGRSQPYRLLLTSANTGSDNAISITNNLGPYTGTVQRPNFNSHAVGSAHVLSNFTGTSVPSSNSSSGVYTGSNNKTYQFTILTGGTVGTTDGIQVGYTDSTGTQSGTITLNSSDTGVLKDVAEGVQVQFAVGTLVAGQKFSIDTFVPTVQEAADAVVTLGSGSGTLNVTSSTNQLDNIFPGVALRLHKADPAKDIQLSIGNDTTKASGAIQDFVDTYNDLINQINDQTHYDPQTKTAGVLLGNSQVIGLQDQLRNVLLNKLAGVTSPLNRLSALGITFTDKGTLEVNQAKVNDVLQGRTSGITLNDVRRLFALTGTSTNSKIQFVSGSTRTRPSETPYQIDLTQTATQGSISSSSSLAATTVVDASNDALILKVDGVASGGITLTHGTYSRQGLAQVLQAQINNQKELAGHQVNVQVDSDKLLITSNTYGSGSQVALTSGSALNALGLVGTEMGKGQDVAGTFLVNGQTEPAIGSGQFLVGSKENANTADLQVRVTATTSQLQSGVDGELTVTRGFASQLDVALNRLLDPVNGRLKFIDDSFQNNIDSIQTSIDRQNLVFEAHRQQLVRQFAALETTVSQLKNTGDFLTSQFASLKNVSK